MYEGIPHVVSTLRKQPASRNRRLTPIQNLTVQDHSEQLPRLLASRLTGKRPGPVALGLLVHVAAESTYAALWHSRSARLISVEDAGFVLHDLRRP
jgi:hypothetical protein